MKPCKICGVPKALSEYHKKHDNKDGLNTHCRACHAELAREYKRGKGKKDNRLVAGVGGPYKVVYDPLDSFTCNSSFTRTEIREMIHDEYLAIGTRFRRGIQEWEVSTEMTLREVTA